MCDSLLFPLQSPISLSALFSEQLYSIRRGVHHQERLVPTNFEVKPNTVRVVNDGSALVYTPRFDESKVPTLVGGPLIPGQVT